MQFNIDSCMEKWQYSSFWLIYISVIEWSHRSFPFKTSLNKYLMKIINGLNQVFFWTQFQTCQFGTFLISLRLRKRLYGYPKYWKKRQLSSAIITSKFNQTCRLRTKTPVMILSDGKKIPVEQVEKNLYVFKVIAGKKYQIVAQ